MPKVETYRRLAPFGARELVDSANALLRGRDRLRISERTLRYYISQKLLPPPEGPPKIARYSFEHLVGLIAIRGLQDRGVSLDRIRDELAPLWTGDARALEATLGVLDYWLQSDGLAISEESIVDAFRPFLVQEPPPRAYAPSPPAASYARRRGPDDDQAFEMLRDLSSDVTELRREIATQSSLSAESSSSPLELDVRNAVQRLQNELQDDRERSRYGLVEMQRTVAELAEAVRALSAQVAELREAVAPPVPPDPLEVDVRESS